MISLTKENKQKIDSFFKKCGTDDIISYLEEKYGKDILKDVYNNSK